VLFCFDNIFTIFATNTDRWCRCPGISTYAITADIRTTPYTTSGPWLLSDIIVSNNYITGFSDYNSYKNIKVLVNNNVLINHSGTFVPAKELSVPETINTLNTYVGGLNTINTASYASIESFNGFVDPNNLNFKLTSDGLRSIQSQIPQFIDIPFEEIPTI
jgi:hypothetical protein